jgi:cation/acetate symporter
VIVRFFTVPKVKDARLSAGYALVFIAILYTAAPAVAAFGIYNTIQSTSGKPIDDLPPWVNNWQQTNLIGIEDKNGDGKVQYLADPVTNELRIDKDIMVLASPEIANLPNWVVGLVAAGAMAAALSTAAGLLLVISTSISRDLFKTFRPDISDKKELRIARFAESFFRELSVTVLKLKPATFGKTTTRANFSIVVLAPKRFRVCWLATRFL